MSGPATEAVLIGLAAVFAGLECWVISARTLAVRVLAALLAFGIYFGYCQTWSMIASLSALR